ncbi:hypothetical protein MKZ38_000808 [Zalerion maritima]|uniref:RRM domain-containing protein n=1 Tax=Zalerion maritima TaxID=339359 RepID=A0AAD5WRV2_9PEZI|nr:hypothetical protein MKZ38_000808 [Zalerion maritima]
MDRDAMRGMGSEAGESLTTTASSHIPANDGRPRSGTNEEMASGGGGIQATIVLASRKPLADISNRGGGGVVQDSPSAGGKNGKVTTQAGNPNQQMRHVRRLHHNDSSGINRGNEENKEDSPGFAVSGRQLDPFCIPHSQLLPQPTRFPKPRRPWIQYAKDETPGEQEEAYSPQFAGRSSSSSDHGDLRRLVAMSCPESPQQVGGPRQIAPEPVVYSHYCNSTTGTAPTTTAAAPKPPAPSQLQTLPPGQRPLPSPPALRPHWQESRYQGPPQDLWHQNHEHQHKQFHQYQNRYDWSQPANEFPSSTGYNSGYQLTGTTGGGAGAGQRPSPWNHHPQTPAGGGHPGAPSPNAPAEQKSGVPSRRMPTPDGPVSLPRPQRHENEKNGVAPAPHPQTRLTQPRGAGTEEKQYSFQRSKMLVDKLRAQQREQEKLQQRRARRGQGAWGNPPMGSFGIPNGQREQGANTPDRLQPHNSAVGTYGGYGGGNDHRSGYLSVGGGPSSLENKVITIPSPSMAKGSGASAPAPPYCAAPSLQPPPPSFLLQNPLPHTTPSASPSTNQSQSQSQSQSHTSPFTRRPLVPSHPTPTATATAAANKYLQRPTNISYTPVNNPNYRGDNTLQANQSASIPQEQSCSLWIIGMPPTLTFRQLFDSIRNIGRIYAAVVNQPNEKHATCAVKLVFFELAAAERFLGRFGRGGSVGGFPVVTSSVGTDDDDDDDDVVVVAAASGNGGGSAIASTNWRTRQHGQQARNHERRTQGEEVARMAALAPQQQQQQQQQQQRPAPNPTVLAGYRGKVMRNNILVAESPQPPYVTRCVLVCGPEEEVSARRLHGWLAGKFLFQLECLIDHGSRSEGPSSGPRASLVSGVGMGAGSRDRSWGEKREEEEEKEEEDEEDEEDEEEEEEGQGKEKAGVRMYRMIEFRFSCWRSQAQWGWKNLRQLEHKGVRTRYARDPCDYFGGGEGGGLEDGEDGCGNGHGYGPDAGAGAGALGGQAACGGGGGGGGGASSFGARDDGDVAPTGIVPRGEKWEGFGAWDRCLRRKCDCLRQDGGF